MGINGLLAFLRKSAPGAFTQANLDGMKIAVDVPIFMYKFAHSVGTGKRLITRMLEFANDLIKNNVHPIFVFDGQRLPEKEREKLRRLEAFKRYSEKHNQTEICVKIDNDLEYEVEKTAFSKKPIEEDFEALKIAFQLSGFEIKNAKYEAEALCSHLCTIGKVDAVVTEDSDALAYLAPKVIVKWNKKELINLNEIYRLLNLNAREFQDMCVIFGNDFNERIDGIGPVKSYSLIKKYSSLENILKQKPIQSFLEDEMKKTKKIFECYCYEL